MYVGGPSSTYEDHLSYGKIIATRLLPVGRMLWQVLLLCGALQMSNVLGGLIIDGKKQLCYARQHDLNLALVSGISDMEQTSSQLKCGTKVGSMWMILSHSFLYAIEEVNSRTDLLPNITLGFVILDDCGHSLTALANMMYLLPLSSNEEDIYPKDEAITCEDDMKQFDVVGIVGPARSTSAVMIGGLSSIFHIPLLLTYGSSDEFTDKTRFAYTMRMVPPDRFQAEAITDILLNFGWDYVSLLYSEGSYGENGAKQVEKNAKKRGICIAFRYMISLDFTKEEAETVARKLFLYKDARVVIVFTVKENFEMVLPFLEDKNLADHFVWLGSDAIHLNSFNNEKLQKAFDGSLAIGFQGSRDERFHEYFRRISPQKDPTDPFIRSVWEKMFDCSWDETLGNKSCYLYQAEPFSAHYLAGFEVKQIDAVWVYAYALHELINKDCPTAFTDKILLDDCVNGEKLHQIMLKMEFDGLSGHIRFDSKGDFLGSYSILQYQYSIKEAITIGTWNKQSSSLILNEEKIKWIGDIDNRTSSESVLPESVCSKPCLEKEYFIQKELPCCWECRSCRNNEILIGNKTGCATCDLFTWPDEETATHCTAIEPEVLQWTSPLGISVLFISCLGLCMCLVIGIIFVKNSKDKLVKASSRQLMAIILLGISMAYLTVILILMWPSTITCYLSRFGFNLSVSFIYAPLMVKTSRVYTIFTAGKKGTKRPLFVGTKSQLILVTIMVVLQLSLCVATAVLTPPEPVLRQQVQTEKYVERLCSLPLSGLIPPLSLNLLFILVCAVYGFLTRKLPENFNESWYIFVSVTTTTFLWLVFLPAYFTAFYAVHQVVLLASCLIFNGTVTLLSLYVPKVYCIYFVDKETVQLQTVGTVGTSNSVMPVMPMTTQATSGQEMN